MRVHVDDDAHKGLPFAAARLTGGAGAGDPYRLLRMHSRRGLRDITKFSGSQLLKTSNQRFACPENDNFTRQKQLC
jgi:hypothetical protein